MPEDGLPTIMDQKSCTLKTGEPWEYGASKLWDGTLGNSRHSMAALPMVHSHPPPQRLITSLSLRTTGVVKGLNPRAQLQSSGL